MIRMFKPERMSLLQIVVLDEDLVVACAYLARQRVIHLVDRAAVAPALHEGTPAFFSAVHADLEMLYGKLDTLREWVEDEIHDLPDVPATPHLDLDPQAVAASLKEPVLDNVAKLASLRAARERERAEIARLARISDTLQSFETAGISYMQLLKFRYFGFAAGTMPFRYLHTLRLSLPQIPHHIELRHLDEDDASVIVVAPSSYMATVRSGLKSVYFTEVAIPEEFHSDTESALDSIEIQLWQHREELAMVNQRIKAICRPLADTVFVWRRTVRANLRVLDAMQLFGKTARTTLVNGWVPRKKAKALADGLRQAVNGRVMVDVSSADSRTGLARDLLDCGRVRVPTKFAHPFFLKPFESLVTTYGYPEYNGVDPTFFVAVTFLLMFGMMFGDVGQGCVLMALGFLMSRSKLSAALSSAGWLMVCTGASATVFGFMFGSVFGIEHLIPALWVMPMEHVSTVLSAAIGVGIAVLSLGVILNIAQAWRRRDMREAFFGQWGILSGVFYWMTLAVFYLTIVQERKVPFFLTIGVLLTPIALVLAGDLLYDRLFRRGHAHGGGDEGGHGHGVAETIFKPVEIVLGLITQTISFVRVGAFALNHAALMMVVFILARMNGEFNAPDATFQTKASYILFVVVGNLFVMILEGMVVFIQCLRLEYYEFFSKFFSGDGVKYEPLQVEETN